MRDTAPLFYRTPIKYAFSDADRIEIYAQVPTNIQSAAAHMAAGIDPSDLEGLQDVDSRGLFRSIFKVQQLAILVASFCISEVKGVELSKPLRVEDPATGLKILSDEARSAIHDDILAFIGNDLLRRSMITGEQGEV